MRVFVTGATGFIGSRIVPELLRAGHRVTGLTRSAEGARRLEAAGAQPYHGTLEEPDSIAAGAADADAVIHTAFDHDFRDLERFRENCAKDTRVIGALAAVLAGSARPLLLTSGIGMGSTAPGEIAVERVANLENGHPRAATERAGQAALERGVSVGVVRLPQVHDTEKQGLITPYVAQARSARACVYVGAGTNRYAAAHVDDVARLYRLALEHHAPGARWHAVAEEGIPFRTIAETIAVGMGVPVRSVSADEATALFGFIGAFAAADMAGSSAATRRELGWEPAGPGLLDDLRAMRYEPPVPA